MCGIAGFIGTANAPSSIIRRLTEALAHRGPDDEGYWVSADCRVGLGHRRLSVVDLTPCGRQPMSSQTGRYRLSFNGEVYNFLELRTTLTALGHSFRGTSDTEVMLAAFEQWGLENAIARLNGMFAAALWDSAEGRLHLFRDRLGVKPLYYQWRKGALYFSSEMTRPFRALASGAISVEALALYFHHNWIPAPHTILEGIYKLPAGEIATVSVAGAEAERFLNRRKYWDTQAEINSALSRQESVADEEESVERIDAALSESVKKRMIADVPLGVFLSGGIDSSLVVSHAQRHSRRPVRTFTIGFDDDKSDEARFALRIAAHLGTEHTQLHVTAADALAAIPGMPQMYGEPFADSSQIPTHLLCKLTHSEGVTVALSGDGGDELFGGYGNYVLFSRHRRGLSAIRPNVASAAAQVLAVPAVHGCFRTMAGQAQDLRVLRALRFLSNGAGNHPYWKRYAAWSLPEMLVRNAPAGSSLPAVHNCTGTLTERAMCQDLMSYLPDDILAKVDRASMANALEVRVPFCDDVEIFRVAWSTPLLHKVDSHGGKKVLKKALARYLPVALFDRPKQGFMIPLTRWLTRDLDAWVRSCVEPDRIRRDGFLNLSMVEAIYTGARAGDPFMAHKLWAICMFQSWLDAR